MPAPLALVGLYACAPVGDLDAAVAWYTMLMGRAPDDRPMPDMAQWRNMGAAGVQLWAEPEHAGHGRMTIVVAAMDAERARLEAAGIRLGPDNRGEWGVVAQLLDPAGNRITLAEPPPGFADR